MITHCLVSLVGIAIKVFAFQAVVGGALHQATNQSNHTADQSDSSELLFDLLFKSQALRMNDQRCDLNAVAGGNVVSSNNNSGGSNIDGDSNNMLVASGDSLNAENDSFLDLLINLQVSHKLVYLRCRFFCNELNWC